MAVAVRRVIVAVITVAWRGAAEIVVLIAVKLECKTALGAVVVAVLKLAVRTLVVGSLEQSTRRQAEMDIVTVTTVRCIVVVVVVSRSIMVMPRCR